MLGKKLGDLYTNVSAKGVGKTQAKIGQVDKTAKKTSGTLAALQGAIIALGATAVLGAIRSLINEFKDYAVLIDKATKVTGIAAEELQRLKYATDQEHASFEQLAKGLQQLTRRMSYARDGMATYTRVFDRLGISATDNIGKLRDVDTVFYEVIDALSIMESDTERTAMALELFGRSGAELVPFMKMGREEIERLGDEAERLGLVLDEETIKAGKRFDDELTRLKGTITGLKLAIGENLIPALQDLTEILGDIKPILDSIKWYGKLTAKIREVRKAEEAWIERKLGIKKATEDLGGATGGLIKEMKKYHEELKKPSPADPTKKYADALKKLSELHPVLHIQRKQSEADFYAEIVAGAERERAILNYNIAVAEELALQEQRRLAYQEMIAGLQEQAQFVSSILSPVFTDFFDTVLSHGEDKWFQFGEAVINILKRIMVQMLAMAALAAVLSFLFPGLGQFASIFGSLIGMGKSFQTPKDDWYAYREGLDFSKNFMAGFNDKMGSMAMGAQPQSMPINVIVHTGDPSTFVEFARKMPKGYKSKFHREVTLEADRMEI